MRLEMRCCEDCMHFEDTAINNTHERVSRTFSRIRSQIPTERYLERSGYL